MYNILVAGAGYLGSAIARDFKARKQRVYAITRNLEKAAAFEKQEIHSVVADLVKPGSLPKIPAAHFIVIAVAPDESTEDGYRKIYLEGLSNFLSAIGKNPRPYLMVLISSTSVWSENQGQEIREEIPAAPDTEKGKILLQSEDLVLKSGYPSAVLRLSGIYGPGRNRLASMRKGVWPKAQESDGYMNMIHRDDVVQSMLPLFKSSKEGEIYIGTDDEPVLRSEFCRWLAPQLGLSSPGDFDLKKKEGKRLRNQKIKSLGISFRYPSFREGYSEILNQETKKE